MRTVRFAIRLLTTVALIAVAVCVVRFPTARRPHTEPRMDPATSAPAPKPFEEIYGIDPTRMLLYQKEQRTLEDERRIRELMEQARKTFEALPKKPEQMR